MLIVNNSVLCTEKFTKREDFKLSVLITKNNKGNRKKLLEVRNRFMTSSCIHEICIVFCMSIIPSISWPEKYMSQGMEDG